MKSPFELLINQIKEEKLKIERVITEFIEFKEKIGEQIPSKFDMAVFGNIIANFYSGVENIFEYIAKEIDSDLSSGKDWHIKLLDSMSQEIVGVRPAVISKETKDKLSRYLKFRHKFRHMYFFDFNWEEMDTLLEELIRTKEQLFLELNIFEQFLNTLKENC